MISRSKPYVYATWLPALLNGERSCEWSVWLRTHNTGLATNSTFDLAAYKKEVAPLLQRVRSDLEGRGYTVYSDERNSFKLTGRNGTTLAGKPDIVAVRGNEGVICDLRTGKPHDFHQAQVTLYMWAIPKAFRAIANVKFEGRVAYKDTDVPVPSTSVDRAFEARVGELINRVAAAQPAHKAPSANECFLCPITLADCPERIDTPEAEIEVEPF